MTAKETKQSMLNPQYTKLIECIIEKCKIGHNSLIVSEYSHINIKMK